MECRQPRDGSNQRQLPTTLRPEQTQVPVARDPRQPTFNQDLLFAGLQRQSRQHWASCWLVHREQHRAPVCKHMRLPMEGPGLRICQRLWRASPIGDPHQSRRRARAEDDGAIASPAGCAVEPCSCGTDFVKCCCLTARHAYFLDRHAARIVEPDPLAIRRKEQTASPSAPGIAVASS